MGTDLTSYSSVLTEAITLVTALVAAVAGLLAALRFKRREQVAAPVPTRSYVTSGSSATPMEDFGVQQAVRCAVQGTVTKIPRWISSTRTPIVIIVVLLFAISTVVVNRVQVWDGPTSSSLSTPTRLVTGIDDYAVSIGPDNVGVIKLKGQLLEAYDLAHGEKVVVFVHGVSLNNAGDKIIDPQVGDIWVKVGEATLDARGAWTAVCQVPGIAARDITTTSLESGKISIAAIVVSPETARFMRQTMTLADLDAYGRSQLVAVAVPRERPGGTNTVGVTRDTSPATPVATGAPAH